jgi:glycine betaine/proline transport system permease protein
MATRSLTLPSAARSRPRLLGFGAVIAALVCAVALGLMVPDPFGAFPERWNLGLRPVIDGFADWVIFNRETHPAFVYFFEPLSNAIDGSLRFVNDLLTVPPWTVIVALAAALGYAMRGWKLALGSAAVLLLAGLFGLWEPTMSTLSLMGVAVALSLLIGIPVGVLAALRPGFERALRPLLDAMQTMPAFVYLVPVVLFFGIARVPAVIATMIYAIPPAIRLTTLGIKGVSPSVIDAAKSFGATRRQLLFSVQLPLAMPAILAGVNQTIMMALSIVVIAAIVGAGGLGRTTLNALQRLEVGKAFEAGLIIVLLAMTFDRISNGAAERVAEWTRRSLGMSIGVALAVGLAAFALGRLLFPESAFPASWQLSIQQPIDALVIWVRDTFFPVTRAISSVLTLGFLNPLRDVLQRSPWIAVIVLLAGLAWLLSGGRLALITALLMTSIGLFGMWTLAMDTFSQILITMLVTMLLAIPLGVLASQSKWISRILGPVNDFLQTVPTFVFLLPVIMLFSVGRVPGLIAAALYALPVGIKLTELGIRQVPAEAVEAATAFGSTRWQSIAKVQLPLARAAIAVAVNQMIMMVLAMVVISGMVGGAGLGLEAVDGLTRSAPGQGVEAGLAIVFLAIVLDRITQAWAARSE